jgi:hypothetical protein
MWKRLGGDDSRCSIRSSALLSNVLNDSCDFREIFSLARRACKVLSRHKQRPSLRRREDISRPAPERIYSTDTCAASPDALNGRFPVARATFNTFNLFKEITMQQIKPTRTSIPSPAPRRFDVFVVEDYTKDGEEKSNWIRLGVAFENKDGKGCNLQLSAIPVTGKLVMRLHEPKQEG